MLLLLLAACCLLVAAHHWTGKWHKPCLLLSQPTLSPTAPHIQPRYQTPIELKVTRARIWLDLDLEADRVQYGPPSFRPSSAFPAGFSRGQKYNRIQSDTDQMEISSRYSISGMIAGQEGDGRELPGMMPKKLLPRVRLESRCAAAISWPPPGPCSTCRWATLLLPGSRGGGGGGSAATGNSFGFPAWSCSGGAAQVAAGQHTCSLRGCLPIIGRRRRG